MAKRTGINIEETEQELREIKQKQPIKFKSRVQMLLLIKSGKATSKLALATALSVNHNTIQKWRVLYKEGGMTALLSDGRGGHKPSLINEEVHKAIAQKLNNPHEAFRSFEELRAWVDKHYVPGINYHTVNKYVKRHFGAKLKTARKSHIQKDEQAGAVFLKTR